MYKSTIRDRIVYAISSWLFNHLATAEYRSFVTITSKIGVAQFDKEIQDVRDVQGN